MWRLRFNLADFCEKSVFSSSIFVKGPFYDLRFLWRVCFEVTDFCEGSVFGQNFLLDKPLYIAPVYNEVVHILENFHYTRNFVIKTYWIQYTFFFIQEFKMRFCYFFLRSTTHYQFANWICLFLFFAILRV